MRTITNHKINPCNDVLDITVLDEPGPGGANHLYQIQGFHSGPNPSDPFVTRYGQPSDHTTILFQNGPIGEVGVNGITNEALLAIVEDRLSSFQDGPYACEENAHALRSIRDAQHWLLTRTKARMDRGVEGTHAK